jgi:putative MATE family efflux protein
MAQIFGAGRYEKLKREVSTALIAGIIFTITISIVCIFLTRWILVIIDTPVEILDDAQIFLQIIFGGLIFTFLYNFYSSSLRAIGDSKTPLVFLIISCILNAILCIVLITVFKLGVEGSAIATVTAQAVSSLLCIIYVYRKIPLLSLKRNEFIMDNSLLKLSIQYSWVTALQQTCIYIGKLLVQGAVNPFGTNAIAAFNSVTRIDSFVFAFGESYSASVATYSAQNKGAGKMSRITEGFRISIFTMVAYSITLGFIVFIGAESIMKLFVTGEEIEVIKIGIEYLKIISVFYILSNTNNVFQGLFRGIGKLRIPFWATFIQIAIRVILSYILSPYFGMKSISFAIGMGWSIMLIFELACYKKYFKQEIQTGESA